MLGIRVQGVGSRGRQLQLMPPLKNQRGEAASILTLIPIPYPLPPAF